MHKFKLGLLALVLFSPYLSGPAMAQDDGTVAVDTQSDRDSLAKVFRKATRNARKAGDITWRQAGQLRVFSRLPSGIQQIEDAAVMKMALDPSIANVPKTEDGKVDRAAINWEEFLKFLEGLLPLILQLIDALGSVQPSLDYVSGIAMHQADPLLSLAA